jgi:hypothetical protein
VFFVDVRQLNLLRIARGTLLIGVCLGLVACSASTQPVKSDPQTVAEALDTAKASGLKWEISVLEDGKITPAENEEAADHFATCVEKLGYVLDEPKYLDPVNGQQWRVMATYQGGGKAPESKMRDCSDRWSVIETPYVMTTSKKMDPRLLARFKQCLDEQNLPYTGNETNYNEFTKDLSDQEFAYGPYFDCLSTSADDVFPDLPGVSVGR